VDSQLGLIVAGVGYLDKDTQSLNWPDAAVSRWGRVKDAQGNVAMDANGGPIYDEADLTRYVVVIPTRLIDHVHLFNPQLDKSVAPFLQTTPTS
jgi:hypothetical protein